MSDVIITERGVRDSALGPVLQLKVFRSGYPVMTWREVWEAFTARYPGRWAMQMFPPREALIDGKAVYHLFVLDQCPQGFDLTR